MLKHRKLLILAVLLAALGTSGYFLFPWFSGSPLIARLLPDGDRLAYVNLRLVRPFWDLTKSKPLELEGNYQEFVNQTGIQFERDLDEAAISWLDTADGTDAQSAAIFVGHFDAARLKIYLQRISSQTENYRGSIIYSVPNGDHSDRVCVLDSARVASTRSSADAMHQIIDRTHEPSRGPWLLQTYYQHVPSASLGWIMSRISAKSSAPQIGGLTLNFLANTVTVGSVGYDGSLRLRADIFAVTDTEARHVVDSANTFLALYRRVGQTTDSQRADPDVKAALDSVRIEQKGNTAIFTAMFPHTLLKKIVPEIARDSGPRAPSISLSPVWLYMRLSADHSKATPTRLKFPLRYLLGKMTKNRRSHSSRLHCS